MKLILRLKSWQLFLILLFIPVILSFFHLEYFSDILTIILTILIGSAYFFWLLAIGLMLPKKLDKSITIPSKSFKFHFIGIILVIVLLLFFVSNNILPKDYAGIIIIPSLYYFYAIFIIFRYVSKVIASVELKRLAKAPDYMGYFMLIWFFPIGVWFIQPKLNKYFED